MDYVKCIIYDYEKESARVIYDDNNVSIFKEVDDIRYQPKNTYGTTQHDNILHVL